MQRTFRMSSRGHEIDHPRRLHHRFDVSEAPDAYYVCTRDGRNFIDLLEGFDKTPLWCRPNQRIARITLPKVLSPLPRRSQTANVGVPTHFSNHEAW